MTHASALGALDAFWATVRRQAERDPAFASQLTAALGVPVQIVISNSADVTAAMSYLDPFVIAGKGLDEFRATFGPIADADLKKIIKAFNLAPPEMLKGKGSPKGAALVTLMWDAASAQRKRMQDRS